MIQHAFILLFVVLWSANLNGQFSHDARIEDDLGLRQVCYGQVIPVLKIRNLGTEIMSGCVVETWKNGVQVGSFDWQLAVPAAQGELRQPSFPAVSDVAPGDVLQMRIISVNTVPDQDATGNFRDITIAADVPMADTYTVEVTVTSTESVTVDWMLRDESGVVVAQDLALELVPPMDRVVWVELDPSSCYSIEVNAVDGSQFVGGALVVRSGGNEVVGIGAADVASGVRKGFETGVVAAVEESEASGVRMFWNEDQGRLMIQRSHGIATAINIHDAAGRVVFASGSADRSVEEGIQLDMLRPGSYVATSTTAMGEVTFMRFVKAGW
jgi:hypothetical protein